MKKLKSVPKNLKDQIAEYLTDSYITIPNDCRFDREFAIIYLHQSITRIRGNYGQIVLSLASTFSFEIKELEEWLARFNSFVESEQENIHKMENFSWGEVGVSLTHTSVAYFNSFINHVNSLISELASVCSSKLKRKNYNPENDAVFIVHGHDESLKKSLIKGLKKNGFNPIVLSDMDDSGIPLFEKFEKHANRCMKAIILMTKDDCIRAGDDSYYQARPNVLIEFGFFLNLLNREDIIVICEKDCRVPSDIAGVSYLEYDSNTVSLVRRIIKKLCL